jgi:hypothetical protein
MKRILLAVFLLMVFPAESAVVELSNPTINFGTAGVPIFPANGFAIVASDSNTFSAPVVVYVGVTGNVAVVCWNASVPVTFTAIPAGDFVPCAVKAVYSTGTTASSLSGVY